MNKKHLVRFLIYDILVLLLFLSLSLQADSRIDSIRAQYKEINSTKYSKIVEKTIEGLSAEGGIYKAYIKNGAIVKIKVTFLGEIGRSIEEYYYKNGQVVFVFTRMLQYDKPMGKVIFKRENRYYFDNSTLIKWLDNNKKSVSSSSRDFQDKGIEFLISAKGLKKIAKLKYECVSVDAQIKMFTKCTMP